MRLLLVEDDTRLAEFLAQGLAEAGFVVDTVAEAGDAEAALDTVPYDLLILDLGLPDGDGMDLLARLRARGEMLPILVLTARGALADRVSGLNRGADDYVLKPCATEELVARAKALLRRPGGALGAVLILGNLRFDTLAMECAMENRPLDLSRRELAVLETLLRRAGRVVPKRVLEEKVYGFDDSVASNSIEVHISRLRRKLEAEGATVRVHTLRGIGYMLSEEK
ncbi:response regulator [Nitrospirillum viridazoti]|uniref:DNA-binding response regulator n=1 Tax=Nitrospirillum viridazoti CBAmc TaxID=1441467 RepID=A0A248JZW5_9PROT|nr:response regulator transcription factor [Nitrospirillum amazonense]ASG24046.1 DNA-binding response regulator [Nitrospirillum amazonense CBAmc]TWB40972.1 DNA-binding response OmpR family regulator [Nitrospirillum amazonense]